MIVDFPDDATFLDPLEKHVVISRLRSDGQASSRAEKFEWKYVIAAFKDWKVYVGMLISMGIAGPLYAYALFLPSIINQLGFTSTQAQLLSVPPYAAASISVVIFTGSVFDNRLSRLDILLTDLVVVAFSISDSG